MNVHAKTLEALAEPWRAPWPSDGLEIVGACPVCRSATRTKMHDDLVDKIFRCAPGTWTMWRCGDCRSAYLDPRPTPQTIGIAYERYYTHAMAEERTDYAQLGAFRRLRRRLVNGYTNRRFGTRAMPASPLGPLVAGLLPPLRAVLERHFRSLPGPGGGRRLLDLGFGEGSFLALAASCGWQAEGLDPDPQAVASAARRGLTVHRGSIEHFDGQAELFDLITMSHVIEHVHDPAAALRSCHRLLRPGGTIWIETPNIDSQGHRQFGSFWRGLEPPRHLVLFNSTSLRSALADAGFVDIRNCPRPSACPETFKASHLVWAGLPYSSADAIPLRLSLSARLAATVEAVLPDKREFLVMAASKATE